MKSYLKYVFAIALTLVFVSCGDKKTKEDFGKPTDEVSTTEESTSISFVDQGKAIFEGKGACVACHKPNVKIIGPSLADISKIYKDKNASIVSFLKEESEPIVDPSQYEVMKTNFTITKTMSEEELKALEAYVLSF